MAAIGVDSVFIGDSSPTDEDLNSLVHTQSYDISLRIDLLTHDPLQLKLLHYRFTARFDEARDAVRAKEGEALTEKIGGAILPENTIKREYGNITIDNENAGRYMGELQIVKTKVVEHIIFL